MTTFDNIKLRGNADFNKDGDLENHNGKDLVLFYGDYCGHCVKFKPVFSDAALMYGKSAGFSRVSLPDIDKTFREKLSKFGYKIGGIPALYGYYNGGNPQLFGGDRSPKAIKDFIDSLGSRSSVAQQRPSYKKKRGSGNRGGSAARTTKFIFLKPTKKNTQAKRATAIKVTKRVTKPEKSIETTRVVTRSMAARMLQNLTL